MSAKSILYTAIGIGVVILLSVPILTGVFGFGQPYYDVEFLPGREPNTTRTEIVIHHPDWGDETITVVNPKSGHSKAQGYRTINRVKEKKATINGVEYIAVVEWIEGEPHVYVNEEEVRRGW